MIMWNVRVQLVVLALALTSCGGGGSKGPATPEVTPTPVAASPSPQPSPGSTPDTSEPTPRPDADSDGVADADDKCAGTPADVVVDAEGCVVASRVLVFSKTTGFRHESIGVGKTMLQNIADRNQWEISFSENGADFNSDNLARYKVVVWLSTTGDPLNDVQQDAFEDYVNGGGGYVGIHAAADTEYDWPYYGDLVGAYFKSHPAVQDATLNVEDNQHESSTHIGAETWAHRDEWYNFRSNPRANVTVVLSLDESSYSPGADAMGDHPISWYHTVGDGRSFYTALGHTNEAYTSTPNFEKHVEGAIAWAGDMSNAVPTWQGAPPEASDFEAVSLAQGIHLPVGLDISTDGEIYVIGRAGDFYAFENGALNKKSTIQTQRFNRQQEGGLIGFALDPNFTVNRQAYFHYTHPTEDSHRVTRIKLNADNTLDMGSEIEVLSYDVKLNQCCHQAGAMKFGGDGNLYISTGDNTNPFASGGYAPIDERSGRGPWDAQKSSANTNDLRGKILRIKPTAAGGYTIPEGNLFAGDALHRREIYTMGNRNPYRIAIDSESNQLFWGDVGPDANTARPDRGPTGYDEINRTSVAGNFGWPYFAGMNEAYNDFTFQGNQNNTGVSGAKFDPQNVKNDSPNNTGSQTLPNATPAWVKLSHRATMVGDVYRWDGRVQDEYKLPSYFHGRLIYWNFNNDKLFEAEIDVDTPKLRQWFQGFKTKGLIDMRISPKNNRLYMVAYGGNCCDSPPDKGGLIEIKYTSIPGALNEATNYAINAGGGNFNTASGVSYEADEYFSDGEVFTTDTPISGTTDDTLYSSHRWFDGNFSYNFPVKNGVYKVKLLFADTFIEKVDERVFSVDIEGSRVITDFDIVKDVGNSTATERTFDARVDDGVLDISFIKGKQNPIISAITVSEKTSIPIGSLIGIRADINGKLVVPNTSAGLFASSNLLGNQASFEVREGVNGGIAFYSLALGKYIRVVNDAAAALKVDADTVSLSESFSLEKSGDIYGLVSLSNGKYVVAESAGAEALVADRDGLGTWEAFRIEMSEFCDAVLNADRAIPCRPKAAAYMSFPKTAEPDLSNIPALLSSTGAFKNVIEMTPSDNVIPYDMVAPLWSDRADKLRWVSIPTGSKIDYRQDGTWTWPAGTVFIKHFDLPTDEQDPSKKVRLETRFTIIKEDGSVYAVSYKWRDDQQEADLLKEGLDQDYTIASASGNWTQTWSYPSPENCLECHNDDALWVLGPKTASLNGNYTYPSGKTENQLSTWNHLRLFNTLIDEADLSSLPRHAHISDSSASLELRVRSYWDVNCGFCHGPKGIASNWDGRFETSLSDQGVVNGPVADQKDYLAEYGLSNPLIVDPKNKENSILYIRDKSVGEDKMPPLAKNLEDEIYIDVLEQWINSLQ